MISDWYLPRIGGTEMHLHDLAVHLAGEGHDVQVITSTPGPAETDGIRAHRLDAPLFPGIGLVWTRRAFIQIEAILKNEKCDVVHCHANVINPVSYGGAYLSQRIGFPVIITWKSILGVYTPLLKIANKIYGWSNWPVLFSGVSEVTAKDIKSIVRKKDVHILPNGIDVSKWKVDPVTRDPKEILLVSTMRLARKKRPLAMIKMIAELSKIIPSDFQLKLKIIGEGDKRNAMEKLISQLSLENIIELMGHQSRQYIRELFSKADIYVCPTKWESFGIAVLEARCAGLPVVALASGGVKEIIKHEKEGLLANSDREMVENIARLIKDKDLRSDIADHNQNNPPSMNWKNVIEKHLKLYQLAIDTMENKTRL
ncbi:MAG: glycosyltransferase family 4 protein [Nitrospinales bacterium]